jgi:hypothetical protein
MPSEHALSTVAIVLTRSRVDPSLFGQYVGSETVISKKHREGWLYVLRCETARSFSAYEGAVNELDAHLLASTTQTETFFLPVDNQTTDTVLIGVTGSAFLDEIFDRKSGLFKKSVSVWRMESMLPPRKRAVDSMLIPGLKRLSRQLHVDFAINIHGSEGKRKRGQPRSIYRDAAMMERKPKRAYKKRCVELDASEDEPVSSQVLDIISAAHAAAIASKDELIKSLQAALAAKTELILRLSH